MAEVNINNLVKENILKYCRKKNIPLDYLSQNADIPLKNFSDESWEVSIKELYKISIVLKLNIEDFFK